MQPSCPLARRLFWSSLEMGGLPVSAVCGRCRACRRASSAAARLLVPVTSWKGRVIVCRNPPLPPPPEHRTHTTRIRVAPIGMRRRLARNLELDNVVEDKRARLLPKVLYKRPDNHSVFKNCCQT